MSKYGVRLLIAEIYEFHNSDIQQTTKTGAIKENWNPQLKIKISPEIKGRPRVCLKKFIDLCFQRGYFDDSIIQDIIEFGFDRGYWKDTKIFSEPFKYFITDKWLESSKKERLKEVNGND